MTWKPCALRWSISDPTRPSRLTLSSSCCGPYIITLALAYLFESVLLLCLEGAEFAVEEPFLPGLLAGPGLRLLQGVAQTHVLLQRLLLLLFLKEETSHEALYLSPQLQNDACATIPFGGGLLSLVLTLVYSSATPSAIKYSWSRIRITSPGLCMIRPLAAEECDLESLASRPFST